METCARVRTQRSTTAGRDCFEIWLAGEIDLEWRDDLDRTVQDVSSSGAADVVVHCAEVAFLSSVGISVLWQLHLLAGGRGGGLTLTGPSDAVVRTLEVSGLDTVLGIG